MSFQSKVRILENLSATKSLTASQYLETFNEANSDDINEYDFFKYCIMKFIRWPMRVAESCQGKRSIKRGKSKTDFNIQVQRVHWYNFRFCIAADL